MKTVAVIGAGPAGLSAAFRLLSEDDAYKVTIFEKEESVGGLSRTYCFKGGRVDVGGHRFFSKDREVLALWDSLLPRGDGGMLVRDRSSHILWESKLIEYPIGATIGAVRSLGAWRSFQIAVSYALSSVGKKPVCNLEDFFVDRFGKRLYELFFKGYTEKLWGLSASEMSADWGDQRVRRITLGSLLESISLKTCRCTEDRSLIRRYLYPEEGSGQLWDVLAERVIELGGKIETGCDVVSLSVNGFRVESVGYVKDGCLCSEQFDYVISTMPLGEFPRVISKMPEEVAKVCQGLRYRDMVIVALDFEEGSMGETFSAISQDSWIYTQDTFLPFGRCQILNNWSPRATNRFGHVLLELEYFCDEGDALWSLEDDELEFLSLEGLKKCGLCQRSAKAASCLVRRIKKAYPVYAGAYHHLDVVRQWVDGIDNLLCAGRNGQHRYNNMDHSVKSGFEAADAVRGRFEKEQLWKNMAREGYLEE